MIHDNVNASVCVGFVLAEMFTIVLANEKHLSAQDHLITIKHTVSFTDGKIRMKTMTTENTQDPQ